MALNAAALNVAGDAVAAAITHIGLMDETNTELSGGTYARIAVTWTAAVAGEVSPDSDLNFDVPSSTTVQSWQGFSASSGGTAYGINALDQSEVFTGAGTYVLEAAQTSIDFD